MSKMDDLRAMREARYAQRATTANRPAAKAPGRRPAQPAVGPPPAADAGGAGAVLCGHRAISGRTCTRELGHSAKSHRYS